MNPSLRRFKTMLCDVLIAIGIGVTQLVITIYAIIISIKDNRIKRAMIIGGIGFLGIVLMVVATIRNGETQGKLQNDLDSLKSQFSPAQVTLAALELSPPIETLTPKKDFLIGEAFIVRNGLAKNMRCRFGAFSVRGGESVEQNRSALRKFEREMIGSEPVGEDKKPGEACYSGLLVKLSENDIREITANPPKRIIYVMGHVSWNNDAGADFHTDACAWMDPPKTRVVSMPGWHVCAH